MWSIFVGRSYLRMLSPDFDNGDEQWLGHFDAMRKGATDHIGFNCFVRPKFGIGVRIVSGSWSRSSEKLPIIYENAYGGVDSVALVAVKSNVGLIAFGPALVLRLTKPSEGAVFTVGLNGGVSIYTEEHELDDERQFFAGESLYASVSLALDIRLGKIMTLGATAAYAISTLDRVKVSRWTDPTQELLRPEATIGLRRASVGLQLGVVF